LMETVVWTVLSIGGMVGMFAACVVVVVAGVRVLEAAIGKRSRKPSA
jgi:hypothetical protein